MTTSLTTASFEDYVKPLLKTYIDTPAFAFDTPCSYHPAPYHHSSDSPCFQFIMPSDAASPSTTYSDLPALTSSQTRADDFESLTIWDSVLLSPQYADCLDTHFAQQGDEISPIFVAAYRAANQVLCDFIPIHNVLPGPALSLRINAQRAKFLTCLLANKDAIDAAINIVITELNKEAHLDVPGVGRFRLHNTHYALDHAACSNDGFVPALIPTVPNTPSSGRSNSPVPIPDKGKGRADSIEKEEDLEYIDAQLIPHATSIPSPVLPDSNWDYSNVQPGVIHFPHLELAITTALRATSPEVIIPK